MADHIHTIPVLDGLRAGGCPFCAMRRKLEDDALAFIMGPAYMEEDVRMETDRLGFCPAHLRRMYGEQNRLGLALMLHTWVKRLNLSADKPKPEEAFPAAARSCYLCARTDATFARYTETFFHLWRTDREAQALIAQSAGYCLPHFADMLDAAGRLLDRHKRARFLETVLPNQASLMRALEEDLEWFALKFDYRNTEAPWKNAKDALPRAVAFVSGCNF